VAVQGSTYVDEARDKMRPEPADQQIKKDIVGWLYQDGRVDVSKVNIELDNGRIIVSGIIPTNSVRSGAHADALWLVGVTKDMGLEGAPRLVGDVANILSRSSYVTRTIMNRKLGRLGWDESLLDKADLQIVIFVLEQYKSL
jgi:hypothetical protein